jgi:NAD(P)H-dependent flavin oxidoreductase YrpB (nitropropane dioxygenase family)
VHYLTAPLRAHGRASGDPDVINLWAGQAHALGQDVPAGELVTRLMDEARSAMDSVHRRFARHPDGKAQTGSAGHRDRDASGRR